jgi:hypothetical protein
MQDDDAYDRRVTDAGGEMAARRKRLINHTCSYCKNPVYWVEGCAEKPYTRWRCDTCGLEYETWWWRPLNIPRLIEGKEWPSKSILDMQAEREIGRIQIVNGVRYQYTHDVNWARMGVENTSG